MNLKEQLIKEIEQAPDSLVEEVLNFFLLTKSKQESFSQQNNNDLEVQLIKMSEDSEVIAEINTINEEFSVTEMDGLT